MVMCTAAYDMQSRRGEGFSTVLGYRQMGRRAEHERQWTVGYGPTIYGNMAPGSVHVASTAHSITLTFKPPLQSDPWDGWKALVGAMHSAKPGCAHHPHASHGLPHHITG